MPVAAIISTMFWAVVGAVIVVVLVLAGVSDFRRKRRTGRIGGVNDRQVSAAVRSARARGRRAQRFTRF